MMKSWSPMQKFFMLGIFFVVLGCASKNAQTVLFETPISSDKIIENAILVDARAPFEHQLFHPAQSVNMGPRDFVSLKNGDSLVIQSDRGALARRLSLLGIQPLSRVIVFGAGKNDLPAMGRVAWSLRILGIKNVSTVYMDKLQIKQSHQAAKPYPNQPIWFPEVNGFELTGSEFKSILKNLNNEVPKWVIDVRTEKEYLDTEKGHQNLHHLNSINIPFHQFYNSDGRENALIISQMKNIGIHLSDQIIVVSNNSLRSAAAAFVLNKLGFTHIQNLSGGLNLLN